MHKKIYYKKLICNILHNSIKDYILLYIKLLNFIISKYYLFKDIII